MCFDAAFIVLRITDLSQTNESTEVNLPFKQSLVESHLINQKTTTKSSLAIRLVSFPKERAYFWVHATAQQVSKSRKIRPSNQYVGNIGHPRASAAYVSVQPLISSSVFLTSKWTRFEQIVPSLYALLIGHVLCLIANKRTLRF